MKTLVVAAITALALAVGGCRQEDRPRSAFSTPDHRPRIIQVHAERGGSYHRAWQLWRHSDVIVLGRVVGIHRVRVYPEGWTPDLPPDDPRSAGFFGFGTTFWVQVERYIKGEGPPIIKVFQDGGVIEDTVCIEEDNPLLVVGERYILSLDDARSTEGESGRMYAQCREVGYIYGLAGSVPYRIAELDELFFSDWQKGKIHVRADGLTEPVADPSSGRVFWDDGKELVGVPLEKVIRAIEAGATYRMPGEWP